MRSTSSLGFGTYPCDVSDNRLDELERRVARLEEVLAAGRWPSAVATQPSESAGQPPTAGSQRVDLALIGRTLIAMGGAYLLRAVTDLQVVPRAIGIAAGLAYALSWIVIADRHAARGKRHAAIFDAALGSLIVFPIVWEATVRFHVFTPIAATALVVLGAVALLAVAARRNLQVIAWMASAGVIACATGLAFETRLVAGSLVSVALVGAITWWLADRQGWPMVAWPTAIETDLLGVAAFVLVLLEIVHDSIATMIVALLVAFAGYAIAIVWKPLVRRVDVRPDAAVQSAIIVMVNLIAAFILAQRFPVAAALLPLIAVAGAFAAYIAAIGSATDSLRFARATFSGSALLMLLIGSGFLGGANAAGIVWGLLAVAAALLSIRLEAAQLVFHTAAYAVAAAAAAGLLASCARVFAGLGPGDHAITATRAITFVVIAAATTIVIRSPLREERLDVRIARVLLIANAAALGIGVAAYGGAELVGGEAARAAAVRTIVVGATAAILAWLARLPSLTDLGVLVYPLLIAGGVKMLIEDFRAGRPTTLFVTLAVYGALLVVVARLRRESGETMEPSTP